MKRARASRLYLMSLCGCALVQLPACGEAAGDGPDPGALADAANSSDAGPLDVMDGCLMRAAGGGFASMPLGPASAMLTVQLEARTSSLEADGVFGLSHGAATSHGQLAAAVRFAPSGVIDVRDGASYRAEVAFQYRTGRAYTFRLIADLGSQTYSVYVRDPDTDDVVRLARRYAFPLPPAGAPVLDTLAAVTDGPAGQLAVCDVRSAAPSAVVYGREGAYAVAPLPDDQVIMSDGVATTWRLDAAGQVLDQVARGGEVAADPMGNAYVARAVGGQLSLTALTAGLVPRWNRIETVEPGAVVQELAADAAGVSVALTTAQGNVVIRRYPAAGGAGTQVLAATARAALARDGFAVARTWAGGAAISLHEPGGAVRWMRSFESTVTVQVMTLGLDGRVVIGGHFAQPISFGGPTLEPVYDGEVDLNSFVVALARADGAHVFTRRIPTTLLTGAGGSGGRLVISGETWVTPIFPHLWQLGGAGDLFPGEPYVGFDEQWGRSGRVVVGAGSRIYWERLMVWPGPSWPDSPAFPYLLAIRP
ncbi:MAG TPA: hypothetical protein VNO30_48645 [Kofleriaceae bacterium]|nr:hypothetical protein [Kofleriaceae bacterium]